VSLNWPALGALLGFLALWNLALPRLEEHLPVSARAYVFLQILVDIAVLTGILWQTGGLMNPFATFYVLHMMISGLILDRKSTLQVAGITILCLISLMAADPLIVNGSPLEIKNTPLWLGLFVSTVSLIIIATAFILGFMRRLEQSQEDLRQRERMAAIGRLVAGLAHELGTPLNVIVLLAKDLADGASEQARKDLDTIVGQARRCGDLVALLLGYSRSAQGEAIVPIQMVSWLEEVFLVAKASLPTERIPLARLEVSLKTEEGIFWLPELALRQIFLNLFKNALQAAKNRPEAKVGVEISHVDEMREVRFLVTDNGPGFSPESREHAFDAFYSTKQAGEGDGLGLYVCYHLVQQMNGKISVPKDLQAEGGVLEVILPNGKERP
jgi:signal transduction histidine kinase